MAYETIADFACDTTTAIGGTRKDKKTGKIYKNPTSIEGYYVGTKKGIENALNPEKPNQLHIFKTDKGNVGVWGKTDLDQKMTRAKVGYMTLVTFSGMKPTKKQPMYTFVVKQDADNVDAELASAGEVSAVASEGYGQAYAEEETGLEEYAVEEEAALDEEEVAVDEPTLEKASGPKKYTTPSPDRQARVQSLLGKNKAS